MTLFAIGVLVGLVVGLPGLPALVWVFVAVEHAREWEAFDRRYQGYRGWKGWR